MTEELIKCRVPGKVILHGEHAVVYGKSAVATSVDLYTNVSIKLWRNTNSVQIILNEKVFNEWSTDTLSLIKLIEDNEKLNQVLEYSDSLVEKLPKPKDQNLGQNVLDSYSAFLFLYLGISDSYCSSRRLPLQITVTSDLPIGAGLGSSSSYTVSLTASLFKAFGLSPELDLINKWSFQIDKLFHGKPSGIDNSICTFGGALLFRNGQIVEHLPNIQSLPVILVNTKVPRNTRAMVEKTRQKHNEFRDIVENILSAIDEISKYGWTLIQEGSHFDRFISLFEMNQHLLCSLGAGHPAINKIVDCAQNYGLSSKLTGAGGGGTVIILNTLKENDLIENLYKELKSMGFEYWSVSLGGPGVSFE